MRCRATFALIDLEVLDLCVALSTLNFFCFITSGSDQDRDAHHDLESSTCSRASSFAFNTTIMTMILPRVTIMLMMLVERSREITTTMKRDVSEESKAGSSNSLEL